MERATFLTEWREKKLKGVIVGIAAAAGNAATRLADGSLTSLPLSLNTEKRRILDKPPNDQVDDSRHAHSDAELLEGLLVGLPGLLRTIVLATKARPKGWGPEM